MTQKIVIKVQMSSDRCRPRALALAAKAPGVDSVALAGDAKDQVVVVGDGVDPVKLVSALRRKVGPAQLVQVGGVKKEAEEKKKKKPAPAAAAEAQVMEWHYPYHCTWQPEPVNVAYPVAAACDVYGYYRCSRPEPDICSIM